MATFRKIMRLEISLLWRRRSFWVIQILLLVPAAVSVAAWFISDITPPAEIESLSISRQVLLLILPILVGPAITKDLGLVGEIIWSTPLEALTHLAGLFSGLWVGLLPAVLLNLSVWFVIQFAAHGLNALHIWIYGLPLFLLMITAGLSLALVVGFALRNVVLLQIVWVALWIFWMANVGGLDMFTALEKRTWINFIFHNLKLSPSLGLGLSRNLVLGLGIWIVGVSLSILVLAVLISLIADRRRSFRGWWGVIAPALAAGIFLAGGYTAITQAERAHALVPSPFDIQADQWQVEKFSMEVNVDPRQGWLQGVAQLSIRNLNSQSDDRIVLRLNPGLELTAAQAESGAQLEIQRVGDSVLLVNPAPAQTTQRLELAWQGHLQIPYTVYDQKYQYYDRPGQYYYDQPQPARALLMQGAGYLMRDGDWYPWPWISGPRQAQTSRVVLRTTAENALATVPVQDGQAVWTGTLPAALLVFVPSRQQIVEQSTLYAPRMVDSIVLEHAQIFAVAAKRLFPVLGEPIPTQVVLLPYIGDVIWGGDMLVLPDGSGFFRSKGVENFFQPTELAEGLLERAALTELVRTWLRERISPDPDPFQRVLPSGEWDASFGAQMWENRGGRWVPPVESLDLEFIWDPRRVEILKPSGELSAVGYWIASQLAGEPVYQHDLDVITKVAGGADKQFRFQSMYERAMPYVLESTAANRLVLRLDEWAGVIGREQALQMVVNTLRQERPQDADQLFDLLSARSGIAP
ncbi:MAG: ABC transporter permease [Anaerolineales bacterium]|jgi:hypothetical protein